MTLTELSDNQKSEYNHSVAAAESGSFLQSYEWGEWQEQLGRKAYRYFVKDDGGQIIASMQLIAMPLAFGKYYLYCPYGPVFAGGESFQFAISNFQTIINDLISKFLNAVFIRIEPKFNIQHSTFSNLIKSSNIQPAKTLIIDLSKTEDELLAQMHPKTRYNIRVAQKHGVQIQDEFGVSIGNGLFIKEAVGLIVETSGRQGYKGYSLDYYQKMINCLALQNRGDLKLHIYKAIYNNQLLSSAIYIDFSAKGGSASGGGTRTFLFGGSEEEHKNVMAPYLLHFKAILDAKAAGLSFYDFWGVETSKGDMPGFVRFKLGFAHSAGSGSASGIKEYSGAYDVVVDRFMYKLYRILRKLKRLF